MSIEMNQTDQVDLRAMTRLELEHLPILWVAADLPFRPHGRDTYPALEAQWHRNTDGFIGAFDSGALVGSVVATDDGRRGYINRLAVHPAYRRRGLAVRLVEEAERLLKRRGLTVITALIEDSNIASRTFFASQGYQHLPEVLYYAKRESPES
jgi:ribosomal protein S18 acetylase RimI-like enzyme